VPGAIVLIVLLVLAPVLFILGFALIAGVFGQLLWWDGEERAEGSELLDCNV